ncbi:D-2-hydroxyacid dehydrogenase [Alkalicoccus daliensis]|uniref:Phosphoglycerate dehydrogenase n=1 Tax=Alkalicoccus daliensis TaxID=745820 RepID=A0A1H0IPC1_9BACI|nr:D-2-hydroxyacid dehydrogenase [Alkalicoccus daliensis]SDO33218.1 Phosphoglycerate dehydrogenase [Alkalicoccus daliensis]
MKNTLIVAQDLSEQLQEEVREAAKEWKVIFGRKGEEWKSEINNAEIVAGWKPEMEKELSKDAPLRWIQTWSAGVDSLPLDTYEKKGYIVTSANGVHAYPISETIFALLLGWTRKIHKYVRQQGRKEWHHAHLNGEIHGKTMMIYGVGAIGEETAKIAQAFGMKVIGVRKSGKSSANTDEVITTAEADQRINEADVIVNALPLTDETKEYFTLKRFQKMKKEAFFINIGRGDTVVEEALIAVLEAGQLAGAGLDVFQTEPLPKSSLLWNMEQVIITPHTAGSTALYNDRVIRNIFLPNLKAYLNNEELPVNVVNFKEGY